MDNQLYQAPLDQKVDKARAIITEALERYDRSKLAIGWTGGKDSTILLHIARTVVPEPFDLPIFFIDTGLHFEELYEFVDEWTEKWALDLYRVQPQEAMAEFQRESDEDRKQELTRTMKIEAIRQGFEEHEWQAMMVGIRWDEHEARADENFFSERPDHVRVHPILHFSEEDIWAYTRQYEVPYISLYDQGYRSLGEKPYTHPNPADTPERAGREQGKERLMRRLRDLGYF